MVIIKNDDDNEMYIFKYLSLGKKNLKLLIIMMLMMKTAMVTIMMMMILLVSL